MDQARGILVAQRESMRCSEIPEGESTLYEPALGASRRDARQDLRPVVPRPVVPRPALREHGPLYLAVPPPRRSSPPPMVGEDMQTSVEGRRHRIQQQLQKLTAVRSQLRPRMPPFHADAEDVPVLITRDGPHAQISRLTPLPPAGPAVRMPVIPRAPAIPRVAIPRPPQFRLRAASLWMVAVYVLGVMMSVIAIGITRS